MPVKAVLARVPTWPDDRQQELAELALAIEAELAGDDYEATPDELTAIDEGLAGEAASEEEVRAAFGVCRRVRIEYSKRAIADLRDIAAYQARSGNPATPARLATRFTRS